MPIKPVTENRAEVAALSAALIALLKERAPAAMVSIEVLGTTLASLLVLSGTSPRHVGEMAAQVGRYIARDVRKIMRDRPEFLGAGHRAPPTPTTTTPH